MSQQSSLVAIAERALRAQASGVELLVTRHEHWLIKRALDETLNGDAWEEALFAAMETTGLQANRETVHLKVVDKLPQDGLESLT